MVRQVVECKIDAMNASENGYDTELKGLSVPWLGEMTDRVNSPYTEIGVMLS